jgi:putative transposase
MLIATSFVGVLRRPVESAQYAAEAYRQALAASGITPSMSRKGDCWGNAPMESFFHTLKTERVHHRVYATRDQARRDLFQYIEGFYNLRRIIAERDRRQRGVALNVPLLAAL